MILENINPTLHFAQQRPNRFNNFVDLDQFSWEGDRDPIDAAEIFGRLSIVLIVYSLNIKLVIYLGYF